MPTPLGGERRAEMADTARDRILPAIHHETLDRIPTDYSATTEVTEKLCRHLGCGSRLEMYDRLGIDGIINVAPQSVAQQ